MEKYRIYCTEEQIRKALGLDAPIEYAFSNPTLYHKNIEFIGESGDIECADFIIPTTEEMIGWLEEQRIFVSILYGYNKWGFDLDIEEYIDYKRGAYNSRKEATLAAISKALEYLENKNKKE